MLKILFTSLLCLTAPLIFSQSKSFEKSLDSIQSESEAQEFIKNNKSSRGQVLVFNKEKHRTRLAKDIFSLNVGSKKFDKKNPNPTYYKVIEKISTPYAKASAIFFDGKQKSLAEINKSRNLIIKRFRDGYQFEDLARMYSMDKTAKQGGDLGWFTIGEMPKNIENAVFSGKHNINDIYMVDIPEQDAYYVILITAEKKLIEEVKVLKVTEPAR